MYRTHKNNQLNKNNIGEEVTLSGWVHRRRDHGGVIFIDIRDRYGLTQVVTDPEEFAEAHDIADQVRPEYVIQITGQVRKRPEGQENNNINTGEIEVLVTAAKILSKAKTPPFEIDVEKDVNEEVRLRYRYLDLRRERMKENMVFRHNVVHAMRDFLNREEFLDIETPILIKGTPEGSREYIVPSRIYPGNFYVLPQSPQQLKQLLMIAGMDKYFQVARCFRDEDQRGDRQPEFTQLDLEMSFVDQDDILDVIERMMIEITDKLVPNKQLLNRMFPRISWREAMENYGTDKPDIRYEMKIVDVSDIVKECEFGVFSAAIKSGGVVKALKVDGGLDLTRKEIEDLTDLAKIHGAKGLAYFQVDQDGPKSNILKYFTDEQVKLILEKTDAKSGDIIFFGADTFETACNALGQVRIACAKRFNLIDENKLAYLWVVDFPMFEKDPLTGELAASHHPFTHPKNEDLEKLDQEPENALAYAYDIVLNGYEIGGGSVRIHEHELQKKIFELLKISPADAEQRFGHMLDAFSYGAPPHAGLALGLDRIIMIFRDEPNIREVIAFPKDQKAKDLMLGAPSVMPDENLDELKISINLED
ncbi:aspartate--tRNA ligase [Candidatus Peregrinibacteria bacterium]|nr:aspartate--tRNA ligase [Candidatus Peregrinibacteria bacterium]